MLRIYIDEEYGYRAWLWKYPGTLDQLISAWEAGYAPLNFFDPRLGEFEGDLLPLTCETWPLLDFWDRMGANTAQELLTKCDAYAHVHDDDDTYLKIGDERIPGKPQTNK